jgi:hypothetical protein
LVIFPAIATQNMKYNCGIVYIVRKSEIILSPPNENNPTFIYTKYSVKNTKLQCIVVIMEGSVCQKGKECLELVSWVLRSRDVVISKKGVIREYLWTTYFSAVHFYFSRVPLSRTTQTRVPPRLKVLVTLCLYFASLIL